MRRGLELDVLECPNCGCRVYESYDYPVLNLSADLTAKDFDPDNEAYDF